MNRAATMAGAVIVVLLAACGGGDDGETTSAGDATSAEDGDAGADSEAPDDAAEEPSPDEAATEGEAAASTPTDDPWCNNYISWAENWQSALEEGSAGGSPDTSTTVDLANTVKEHAPDEIAADVTIVMDTMISMVELMNGNSAAAEPASLEEFGPAATNVTDFVIDYCGFDPDFPLIDINPTPPG